MTEKSKFTLITGLQNSGKTSHIKKVFLESDSKKYFINVEMPLSEWTNEPEYAQHLKDTKETITQKGQKITNRIKMEILADFVKDKHLFLDNIHRATTSKTSYVKELLLKCEKATMTTLDDGQITISLRDIILAEEQERINLKSHGKYLPTFDITPIIFGCLIMTAFVTGNHSAGYILAGLATMTFRMRSAKQM